MTFVVLRTDEVLLQFLPSPSTSIQFPIDQDSGLDISISQRGLKDNPLYRNDLRFLKICFLYVISYFPALLCLHCLYL